MNLETGPNDNKRRLDRILRKALPDYHLSLIHRLLRQGKIKVNNRPAQGQERIPAGTLITITEGEGVIHCPSGIPHSTQECSLSPKPPLEILWQDLDLLILNKPAGITVHGPGSLDTQVQQYLAEHLLPTEKMSISFKPGPLHRLDKPSSGVIVFSRSLEGARNFSVLMQEGKIHKFYLAVVEGCLTKEFIWNNLLSRDKTRRKTTVGHNNMPASTLNAVTTVHPLLISQGSYKGAYTLILARIFTGRTHQIRAQAAAHGYPLMGDKKYGGHKRPDTPNNSLSPESHFFLHAWKLSIDGQREIKAPLPPAFLSVLSSLFGITNVLDLYEKMATISLDNNYTERPSVPD